MGYTRRTFAKSALLGGVTAAFHAGRAADAPPNVLFVTMDPVRVDCIGPREYPNVRTPNLDRMARGGLHFRNGFSSEPVCDPTRESCFSRLRPHEHGSLTISDGNKLA